MPREVAAMITAEVHTPTIGIGAGPECDGQVLVFHDLMNLTFGPHAKIRAALWRRRRVDHRKRHNNSRQMCSRGNIRRMKSLTTCREILGRRFETVLDRKRVLSR